MNEYVLAQAGSVLKHVVSKYEYQDLKQDSDAVSKEMVASLQEKVEVAGVRISSMLLNELNYAPEIAEAM